MKTKVLYLIDTLEVGGAEKSLLEILQRSKQTEPLVCHVYAGDSLKSSFEKRGIRVFSLGLTGKYSYATAIRKILKLLRTDPPHLIHTILTRSHFIGRAAGKIAGIPVVSSLVNDSYSTQRFEQLEFSSRWKLKVIQLMDRLTSRWSVHFIANSEAVKSSICRSLNIFEGKVSVIYRGRDPSSFMNGDPGVVSDLRSSLALPVNVPVILNVGRLVRQKGQKDLVAAMSSIVRQHDARLLIAGEGSSRPELHQLIQELNLSESIILLGNRTDVPELLRLANIFVFPSYYEGHPGSLIEAMFAGCPIVASDIPVHRETIRHGDTGLLVPVENPEAIAKSVLWLLQRPEEARSMGKLAQGDAMKLFHIDSIAREHEQIYTDLMQRWSSSR